MSLDKIPQASETTGTLKDFMNAALKEIMSLTHAECGSLFLFDSQSKELVMNSFYNPNDLHLKGLKHRIGEGVSGKVADSKSPVLVKDIDADSRFMRNGYSHYRTKSFISVPIFNSAELLGLINLADKATGEPFSKQDLHVAVGVSKYACLALDALISYTELKKKTETLGKQNTLLEKYASVGKLAAGIVHEVNNPLDGIIRFTNMLLNQKDSNSTAREYLLEIKRGLDRIANITKSLLQFSHQINANAYHEYRYIDAQQLIDEALDIFKEAFPRNNITLVRNYSEGIPQILDFGLSHVLINLIKNALDAMAEGGTLIISTKLGALGVEVFFKDTGIGMNDEIKNKIFEPFFTTKTMEKGSGLGLAICNEIIQKYEGKIEVESSPGEGSCFTILIPQKYLRHA